MLVCVQGAETESTHKATCGAVNMYSLLLLRRERVQKTLANKCGHSQEHATGRPGTPVGSGEGVPGPSWHSARVGCSG